MTKLTEEGARILARYNKEVEAEFPLVQPVQEPVALDLIAANEACEKLNELCREQTAEIKRLREELKEAKQNENK